MKDIKLRNYVIGNNQPLTLMGGVNVLESEDMVMRVAEKFKNITEKYDINWIFKGSYDKANRSSIDSFRGPGMEEGLKLLEKVVDYLLLQQVLEAREGLLEFLSLDHPKTLLWLNTMLVCLEHP